MADNIRNKPNIFPLDSKPYGLTLGEWTAKWWQWALSIPKDLSPLTDSSGKNSGQKQNGPVWFLAGTLGGLAVRTCTVPSEKSLLFPVSCHESSFAEYPSAKTVSDLRHSSKVDIDQVAYLSVVIDGIVISDLHKFRLQSPTFNLTLPENNVLGLQPGTTQAVSDGYWILLYPFSAGKHQIHFGGSCLTDALKVEATYLLIVK